MDVPFLAGDDLEQDFLAGALAGTDVGDEIVLCELAPGGGCEDAASAGLGRHGGVGGR